MGFNDFYEFWLVSAASGATVDSAKWQKMQWLLLEFQPAREANLVGSPPTAIRVLSYGGTDVAPKVLEALGAWAGTPLIVQLQPPDSN